MFVYSAYAMKSIYDALVGEGDSSLAVGQEERTEALFGHGGAEVLRMNENKGTKF